MEQHKYAQAFLARRRRLRRLYTRKTLAFIWKLSSSSTRITFFSLVPVLCYSLFASNKLKTDGKADMFAWLSASFVWKSAQMLMFGWLSTRLPKKPAQSETIITWNAHWVSQKKLVRLVIKGNAFLAACKSPSVPTTETKSSPKQPTHTTPWFHCYGLVVCLLPQGEVR